jgi:hypothetical protein
MEMDLVAHCGEVNRGSYVHSLVLTDIASTWTECTPLVVREKTLLIEALERVRVSLPFPLRALDVDNGGEFLNQDLIEYCVSHGIELTRCRPYRKNDQAWIEQKNGAVVRRMVGDRRFAGIAAAQGLARLYASLRFFVNFFQPSFKLIDKSRDGARFSRRYGTPQTPCERLLACEAIPDAMKARLHEVATALDPLRLLEEIRAVQGHLVALAEEKMPYEPGEPDLVKFLAGLSSAWRAGEVRPTHRPEAGPPLYLRRIQIVPPRPVAVTGNLRPTSPVAMRDPLPAALEQNRIESLKTPVVKTIKAPEHPTQSPPVQRRPHRPFAFKLIWPDICRRLEARPNLNAYELLDQLRIEYPGRYESGQIGTLHRLLRSWRAAAASRGIVVRPLKYRTSGLPRTYRTRPDPFELHWPEMCQCLEADPDQTARELYAEIRSRYPDRYRPGDPGQLRTLQRRLQTWRQQAVRRLVFGQEDRSFVLPIGTS